MRFVGTLLQAVIGLGVIALVWWGAASTPGAAVGPFPGPPEVVNKAIELLEADAFQQHVWASLFILLYALVPALVIGTIVGAVAGASPAGRWLFGPLVITIAAAPLVAAFPLLIMWLGSTLQSKIVFVFLVAAFAVANMIMALWPRRPLKAPNPGDPSSPKPWQTRTPGRIHAVIAGLRLGVVLGVAALVVTELIGSNAGVGYFVAMSSSLFNTTDAMAAALVILVPTIAVDVLLQAIEEQLAG